MVKPGTIGQKQLRGYEPFDIFIYHEDTAILFESERLCSMMVQCARTGQKKWIGTAVVGKIVKRNNRNVFEPLPAPNELEVRVLVDKSNVTIKYGRTLCTYMKKGDDPNPPPPPKDDKDKNAD